MYNIYNIVHIKLCRIFITLYTFNSVQLFVARMFRYIYFILLIFSGSGELEFEEFVTLASRFMVEEDAEAMQQELKEAFRLYDKEG